MVTQCCGKRARIDSIAERILRCHIEAIVLPCAFHGTVNGAKRAGNYSGAMRLTRQIKGPGASPGLERTAYSSVTASAAAASAAIGTLVSDVPGAVLRIERVNPGLRGQNGGEGEQGGESNKSDRFHAQIPFGGAKLQTASA
jgi:hypothetical protein